MEQLAEMGVAIPDEFRPELAMAGEWQTVSETPVFEPGHDASAVARGVRKRKLDGQEEEEEEAAGTAASEMGRPRKVRGSTFRNHPGTGGDDEDLDALLTMTTGIKRKETKMETKTEEEQVKKEEDTTDAEPIAYNDPVKTEEESVSIKQENLEVGVSKSEFGIDTGADAGSPPPVIFKKRKPKQVKR